jgi:hypothetical protein
LASLDMRFFIRTKTANMSSPRSILIRVIASQIIQNAITMTLILTARPYRKHVIQQNFNLIQMV